MQKNIALHRLLDGLASPARNEITFCDLSMSYMKDSSLNSPNQGIILFGRLIAL